ncbi:TetR-like C-terminal domain-containing protein [Variovorax sp. J31P207]|uniref:TetR-like C-terminal domain-containing protein n=1 Tax=Variovorax sp. J31P207 TaxID=3053510 RepID=UPI0025754FF3|nr:TetR-like C-terminal domain-containing protein [Variovorax sp. J31P207]MDM0066743.1 TetR-like C-terminal domain-containing protein [Variovorax sp. J31P207]
MSKHQDSPLPAEPPLGRPRSPDVTQAVRAAALALACEGGIGHATLGRISEYSGVAKTTIYRRWPNAAAIVMDAFLEDIIPLIRYRRKADIRATFIAALEELAHALRGPRGDLLRHLLGAAQSDADLQKAFVDLWIAPRRAQAKEVIADARTRRELRDDLDEDVFIDTLFGAVYYRLLIPYAEVTDRYVAALVDQVLAGAASRDRQTPPELASHGGDK